VNSPSHAAGPTGCVRNVSSFLLFLFKLSFDSVRLSRPLQMEVDFEIKLPLGFPLRVSNLSTKRFTAYKTHMPLMGHLRPLLGPTFTTHRFLPAGKKYVQSNSLFTRASINYGRFKT
jgi:hypothetical protein